MRLNICKISLTNKSQFLNHPGHHFVGKRQHKHKNAHIINEFDESALYEHPVIV